MTFLGLCDGVWAEVSSFTGFAVLAYPDFIELVDFVFVRHDSGIFEQARMSLAAPSVHCLFHNFRVIGQDTSLEVASCFCFHADTAPVRFALPTYTSLQSKTNILNRWSSESRVELAPTIPSRDRGRRSQMDARTEHPLQTVIQYRVLVKVLSKVGPGFFCMNESHLRPTSNELGNECQKWLLLFAHLHIQVFYVSGTNPKSMLHKLNP